MAGIPVGSRPQYLWHPFLFDTATQANLGVSYVHRIQKAQLGPIILRFHDHAWEGHTNTFVDVIYDPDNPHSAAHPYRMWYTCAHPGGDVSAHVRLCYAHSADGLTWEKPFLGLEEYEGDPDTNIIENPHPNGTDGLWGVSGFGFQVFRDTNPGISESTRYKAFCSVNTGVRTMTSVDGINWSAISAIIVDDSERWDGFEVGGYNAQTDLYYVYYREIDAGIRKVRVATSTDFVTWTERGIIDIGSGFWFQLYTGGNHIDNDRWPDYVVGFGKKFVDRITQLTGAPEYLSPTDEVLGSGSCDGWLMIGDLRENVNGTKFYSYTEPYALPGPEFEAQGQESPAPQQGIVPLLGKWALPCINNALLPDQCVRWLFWDPERVASVWKPAVDNTTLANLFTKPLNWDGDRLVINMKTGAYGGVAVGFKTELGADVTGYVIGVQASEQFGDLRRYIVKWATAPVTDANLGNPDLGALGNTVGGIKVHFRLWDGDLFSYQFGFWRERTVLVTDADGEPLVGERDGSTVTITMPDGDEWTQNTRYDGKAIFPLVAGTYPYRVVATNKTTATGTITQVHQTAGTTTVALVSVAVPDATAGTATAN